VKVLQKVQIPTKPAMHIPLGPQATIGPIDL
jgi:hypothetical protein